MGVVRTVVTALPQVATEGKVYRVDAAPLAAAPAASTSPASAPKRATVGAVLGTEVLRVDLAQLLADLEAESRRLIGPSTPSRD